MGEVARSDRRLLARPAPVRVDRVRQGPRLRLVKPVDDEPDLTITVEHNVRGTPAFMAPEQVLGTQPSTVALTSMRWVASPTDWSRVRSCSKGGRSWKPPPDTFTRRRYRHRRARSQLIPCPSRPARSVEAGDRLDATFLALADWTRRAILARLARGEASVTELARPFAISQPAISKHLRVRSSGRAHQRGPGRPTGRGAGRRKAARRGQRLARTVSRGVGDERRTPGRPSREDAAHPAPIGAGPHTAEAGGTTRQHHGGEQWP